MKNRDTHLLFLLMLMFTTAASAQNSLNWYGYFSTRFEKTFETTGPNGTVDAATPSDFAYPFFNIMAQQRINNQFRMFINLNGAKATTIDVRNFWLEYSASPYLNVQVGKIYRKFGLYNEILDAVPTYYGIEPPELFDVDHLLLSRTTMFSLYGSVSLGNGELSYSASTDNGEGDPLVGPDEGTYPLGYDLRYSFGNGSFVFGTSGYSSNGKTHPNVAISGGSPKSGVLNWMADDEFTVFGGYGEAVVGNLTVQAEYWTSAHSAHRKPASVVTLIGNAKPNLTQRARFLIDTSKAVTNANVQEAVSFDIQTWYVRGGYSFETSFGEIAPYVQWDYYKNPETIASKTYGGDDEAGAADDGVFNKSTVGIVFRPTADVALKFDQSYHFYKADGVDVLYPEVRLDLSVTFGI